MNDRIIVLMDSSDILHYAVALGFLIITAFFAYAFYRFALVLKTLQLLIADVEDTAKDIKLLKNKLRFGFSDIAGFLIGRAIKEVAKKKRA